MARKKKLTTKKKIAYFLLALAGLVVLVWGWRVKPWLSDKEFIFYLKEKYPSAASFSKWDWVKRLDNGGSRMDLLRRIKENLK